MIKKLFAGVFASCIAAASPAADNWTVATAQDQGKPLIIRYRYPVPAPFKRSVYPTMIDITWKFDSESGMPSPSEKDRMNELEDSITSTIEPSKNGLLTVVVTGNGACKWKFYAKNRNEFLLLLDEALSGKPKFPIWISVQQDPDWLSYKQFGQ